MGSACSYTLSTAYGYLTGRDDYGMEVDDDGEFLYSVYDPNQLIRPDGRTKEIISAKHMSHPTRLDRELYPGCDTVWKNFKRSTWMHPNRPFLGVKSDPPKPNRESYAPVNSVLTLRRLISDGKKTDDNEIAGTPGYDWLTYG